MAGFLSGIIDAFQPSTNNDSSGGGFFGGMADSLIAKNNAKPSYNSNPGSLGDPINNPLTPGKTPGGATITPTNESESSMTTPRDSSPVGNMSNVHPGKGLYRESFEPNAITNLIQEQVKNSNTSIDSKYFTQTAFIESRFNPRAGSMTGAQGLFQFTKGTWGKRQADRHDPVANTQAAIELAEQNKRYLQAKLGRAPSNSELYMAHNIGAGGAIRLLTASPDTPVTQGLIKSNPAHNPMYLMGKGGNITASEAIRRYRRDFGE